MQEINTQEELTTILNSKEPLLLYFSGVNCSVCTILKPKIKEAIKENFPKFRIYEIKVQNNIELASSLQVFSIPTIITFFETKEYKRYGRNISINLFIEDLQRPYDMIYKD